MNDATWEKSPLRMAKPRVTAGFKWAPGLPQAMAVNTPLMTAIAQPAVMTIQPEFSAFDFFRRTPATTPSPRRIKTRVPMNSPSHGESIGVLRGIWQPFISHSFGKRANQTLQGSVKSEILRNFNMALSG